MLLTYAASVWVSRDTHRHRLPYERYFRVEKSGSCRTSVRARYTLLREDEGSFVTMKEGRKTNVRVRGPSLFEIFRFRKLGTLSLSLRLFAPVPFLKHAPHNHATTPRWTRLSASRCTVRGRARARNAFRAAPHQRPPPVTQFLRGILT